MPPAPPPALCDAIAAAGLPVSGPWVWQSGGQTNLVWHLIDHALIVKLYRATDNPVFANDPQAEALCLARLAKQDLAPRLVARGMCGAGTWLVYRHVPGQRWRADPAPVARLLRRLHALDMPDLRPAPDTAPALHALTRTILSRLPDDAAQRLRALEPPPPPDHPPARRAFLHGDPVPGNILIQDARAVLIDWQCPAIGDPAHDLALFLSPGMQHVYRGTSLTAAERAATLTAYDCAITSERLRALQPAFHWLMAAYCSWKAVQGAPAYAEAARMETAALS